MNGGSSTPGWYYSKAGAPVGQQAGPFSWEQLVSLAQAGAVAPADMVWNPSLPQWLPAVHVQGLLPVAPPGAPYQPYPGQAAAAAKSGGGSWLAWVIPLAALVIAGAGLGIYFGLYYGKDGKDNTAATVAIGTTTTATTETSTSGSVPATTSTTVPPTTTTTAPPTAVWTNLSPAGGAPSARSGQSMVYASGAGRVILFGGWSSMTAAFNDTWAYDPAANTWANLNPAGGAPSTRSGQSMVYASGAGRVILFGGTAGVGGDLNDIWAYDPAANTWTKLNPINPKGALPSARASQSMVYDPAVGKVIMFGGSGVLGGKMVDLNDTWAYDPAANTWADLNPPGSLPPARHFHSMACDPTSGLIYLFGGSTYGSTVHFDDLWAYDPVANAWIELSPTGDVPPARLGPSTLIYDSGVGRVILFGGQGGTGPVPTPINDTWAYDPAANTWTKLSTAGDVPTARDEPSMAYNSDTGKAVLFGGAILTGDAVFNDTWALAVGP